MGDVDSKRSGDLCGEVSSETRSRWWIGDLSDTQSVSYSAEIHLERITNWPVLR